MGIINNRQKIGSAIAIFRKKRGLTIRELADKCNVTYSNISKLENGSYNVSIDILSRICNALGVEITILECSSE